jgi:hypothetical protein
MSNRVRLGTVRIPSGILVIIDAGYAGLWCHATKDFDDDSDWPLSEKDCHAVKDSVDIRVIGANAPEAGKTFNRQWHPLWLYDIPRAGVVEMERLFQATIAPSGLQASLVVNHQRVSHRERVALALEHGSGVGQIQVAGVWASVCGGIPTNEELPVFAEPMPPGPDQDRWRRIYVEIDEDAKVASSEIIGCAGVDWARLMFADLDALGDWRHNIALDGMADCVFWSRDQEPLAQALGAPRLDNGFGWLNLTIGHAQERVRTVQDARMNGWKVAVDYRPHSHHWQLMQRVRASTSESGTVDIGAAKLCGFMTSWGDAIFDILAERDAVGRLARLTIDCGNEEIVRRQRHFEEE